MLKQIWKITCDRCGRHHLYEEKYDRIMEGEFRCNARREIFHNEGWSEMNDDLRHLCPKCRKERAVLQDKYDREFEQWIQEKK